MAPPKDIARSYPKRGLTADVGFRSEPKFCADGSTNFDGSSDFATATNYAGGNAGGTFCFWFKTEAKATNQIIFSNANVTPKDAKAQVWIISSTIKFSDTVDAIEIPSADFDANEWHFGCMVLNSIDGIERAYFNGVEHSTPISFGSGATTSALAIGSRNQSGANYFKGNLAKFKIFNVALTKDQVLELYNNPGLDVPTGLTSSNLRRNYELETDFNDSGADSENATASGSPSFTVDRPQLPRGLDLARGAAQARCFTGRAVNLDGSADYLQASSKFTSSSNNISMAMWVNIDSTKNQPIMHNGDTGVDSFLFYLSASSNFDFYYNDTSGDGRIRHQTTYQTSRWYHLVMVMDQSDTSDHQVTCYVDGVANTTSRDSAAWQGDTNFDIGTERTAGSGRFDGLVSSLKIFDVGLTQAQVRELYHNPEQVLPTGVSASNLRRYCPLSDYNDAAGTSGGLGGRYFQDMGTDGATLEDKSSSNMAFAQPVPCPQLGLQQSAMRIRWPGGSTEHQAVATTAALGTAASVSCWFQVENTGVTRVLWAIGNASGTGFLEAFINASDQLQVHGQSSITVATITDSNWHHLVVMTDSGSPPYKVFLDNSEVSLSGSDTARNLTNGTFEIGNQDTVGGSFVFQGILNDVACWNTELSSSDVSALYNSGVQGMDVGTVQASNLKGWWKCDDFKTFKDYSGSGANAAVKQQTTDPTISPPQTLNYAAASLPENASGSTIVGDFSMKRKGVSILNHAGADDATAIIPAQEAVYPKAGAANGYTIGFCYRKIKDGVAQLWGNTGTANNDQFMCFQQGGNTLRFNLGDGSSRPDVSTTSSVSDSDWHHYTLTISYATTPAECKIYIDGVLDKTETESITGPPALHPMRLGTGYFDGQGPVGCFKFYHVALSANEVERLAFSEIRLIKGLQNE